MIEILGKGVAVGLAVAAPVGPIGILCIRRTLLEGRPAGLASGLGAASADALYGIMVATGLAATGILVSYAGPMEIGGGFLIALLGLLSLRAFLSPSTRDAAETPVIRRSSGLFGAFGTTFALTLSNPMTILAFVGLVAGLGASAASDPTAPYWLVLGVFLGSALWWLFLVHLVLAARGRLSASTTRWLDLVSGGVLLIWGLLIVANRL